MKTNKNKKQSLALRTENTLRKIVEHIERSPNAAAFYGMDLETAKSKHAEAYANI